MSVLGVVVACGKEEEFSSGTEVGFLPLGNMPIIAHSLKTLERTKSVDRVILAVSKAKVDATLHLIRRYGFTKIKGVVTGSTARQSTLKTVFSKLTERPSAILIHEASRPFVSREVFEETVKAAKRYGCAIAAHRLCNAVKVAPKGKKVTATLERNSAWEAETPQAFKLNVLDKIIQSSGGKLIDDESEYVLNPAEVHMVEAGALNLKIRTSEDLAIAAAFINAKIV